jgi:serine/threonine-protein kinase
MDRARKRARTISLGGQLYELGAFLGTGATSDVWSAHRVDGDHVVAIKVLHPELADDPEIAGRLRAEAALMSDLQHPGLPELVGHGRALGGRPCLAMTFAGTTSLESYLEDHGALAPDQACLMLLQVCEAVGYLHRKNLRHGDIKASNIILAADGRPILVDLGVCQRVGSASTTGMIYGTPQYMAPEVICGQCPTLAADIYALGTLLYVLLTGHEPFEGQNPIAVCEQHVHSRPVAPSRRAAHRVPGPLEAMVLRCLAKTPPRRPTLSELAACVARYAGRTQSVEAPAA